MHGNLLVDCLSQFHITIHLYIQIGVLVRCLVLRIALHLIHNASHLASCLSYSNPWLFNSRCRSWMILKLAHPISESSHRSLTALQDFLEMLCGALRLTVGISPNRPTPSVTPPKRAQCTLRLLTTSIWYPTIFSLVLQRFNFSLGWDMVNCPAGGGGRQRATEGRYAVMG